MHFKADHSQSLVFQGDKKCDSVLASDGRTDWFDVGLFSSCANPEQKTSPLAAADGTPLARGSLTAASSEGAAAAEADPASPTVTGQNKTDQEMADKSLAVAQRGRDAYRAGHNDVALAALTEAIELDPRNASTRVDRGNVWYVKRDCAQAIRDFCAAIRLDPNYASAYSNRAFALSTQGESTGPSPTSTPPFASRQVSAGPTTAADMPFRPRG